VLRSELRGRLAALTASAVTAVWLVGCAQPESPRVTMDLSFLRDYAETRGFTAGQPAHIAVTPDGDAVLFLRSGPRDVVRDLYELDVASGRVRCLARAETLLGGEAETLTAEEKARRERLRESAKGITWYRLSYDGAKVLIGLSGRLYVIDRTSGKVTSLPESPAGPARDARLSPDGRYVSSIRGHDLYVFDLERGAERALTTGGTEAEPNAVAEFVAQEEMGRRTGYWWSGDSKHIAWVDVDQSQVEQLFIADARNPDQPPRGWHYPRAGTTNAVVRLGITPVAGGETVWADWDRERFPDLATVRWGRDAPLTIYLQTRDQHEAALYRVDPQSGRLMQLLGERDPAWLNIVPGMPRWLDDGAECLWVSERSGEKKIERRGADGTLIQEFGLPNARLYGVTAVDARRREVVVRGAPTPTESHLYRIAIDTGQVVALTDGRGEHAGVVARNGNIWVHTASLIDGSVHHTVRRRDATTVAELPSVAEPLPIQVALELTTVDTDAGPLHAVIVRPRDFRPGARYPVIDYVYGGPGHVVVSAAARAYLRQQWIADQGFVVVSIDGRGTPRRGRAWERAIDGNVIDLPLADQVAGLQALGAQYDELDIDRAGIYGWSFGGYFTAMAVARRPDVFQAGVAGAPVIDWRDYDTHYTERYLNTPASNPEGYARCSVLNQADQLRRPLLLVHGATDDNVYFTHTLKFSETLFRAGKPHELLVLPGFTHMVPDPLVTMRLYERIAHHFQKHLMRDGAGPLPPQMPNE